MSDYSKRVNSIVIKNLPNDFTTSQLEDLFKRYGKVVSSRILPPNPNFSGGCGFINFADIESCNEAVQQLNNFTIDGYTLRISHATSRPGNASSDRSPSFYQRSISEVIPRTLCNSEDNSDTLPPNTRPQFNNFQVISIERSPSVNSSKSMSITNSNLFQNRGSISIEQHDIKEHEPFVVNKTHNVYLSNLEVPNIVYAATLDDYVSATLLVQQMKRYEHMLKSTPNSNKINPVVGKFCAALFQNDWYRGRILEVSDTRVRVEYIDWGNTGWCDSLYGIRSLSNEFSKSPILCVRCILDGVPSNKKLTDEQSNLILDTLVLDHKLEMNVVRIENGIPYVILNLDGRNLNNEICSILSPTATIKQNPNTIVKLYKPTLDLSETHLVQLTTVDTEPECFHVLLVRDCLPTIMNVLRDWNSTKQPFTTPPKVNTLVCAQYDADDLWYRAWIQNVTDQSYRVYFVDFGNDEIVTIDRLSECPDELQTIPWQSVQIRLADVKLTDDERLSLLQKYETEQLDMKIIGKNQDVYLVDLLENGKSIIKYISELQKSKAQEQIEVASNKGLETVSILNEVPKAVIEPIPKINPEVPIQSSTPENSANALIQTNVKKIQLPSDAPSITVPTQISTSDQNQNNEINNNLTILITEQRKQNRLLEQMIAAVNVTNALLHQLVQR